MIADFEFININGDDLVLVSGSLIKYSEQFGPKKLCGMPLYLSIDNRLTVLNDKQIPRLKQHIQRVFKGKPQKSIPLLKELKAGTEVEVSTLSQSEIMRHLYADYRQPVLITWNGFTDNKIMKRLGIPNLDICLDITTFQRKLLGEFELKLINLKNKDVIFRTPLGMVEKRGNQLNLGEAHGIICSNPDQHNITYLHDPDVDVLLTRCIFKYIVLKMGLSNLTDYIMRLK